MDQDNDNNMHKPGADRTGSDRFKGEDSDVQDVREGSDNTRKAQGDDGPAPATGSKSGNRPRFDRDR